ncbi:MAG: hypothetical protein AB8B88_09595 [Devosiaceae bacterium]
MKRSLFLLALATVLFPSFAYAQETPAPVWVSVTHEVVDLEAWRAVFDSALSARQGAGEMSYQINSFAANPNTIVAVFQWDSAARARAFIRDPLVRNAMRRAGVTSQPFVALYQNPLPQPAGVKPAR